MKIIKSTSLYDGDDEKRNYYIGFEGDKIAYVGLEKPLQNDAEIIAEDVVVTPAFIDSHSHIGMVRAGEPEDEDESNEHMDPVFPLVNSMHSIYMDDMSFTESVESGVLYSVVLPGSGNVVGGKSVFIRNYEDNVEKAYIKDMGIKMALGYNPRSTNDWKGDRPSTRMGAMAILRDNLLKAKKTQNLINRDKKDIDEVDPVTEVFMDIISKKYKVMAHLHKEDDAVLLIQLSREFGLDAIANHCMDIYHREVFSFLNLSNIPIIYGPLDCFPYKVELKHESWKNVKPLIDSGAKFSLMSDHPVILQRNMFYTLRHLLRFGLSKPKAISKITKESADIVGVDDLGQIKPGFKASFVIWNGDPFSLTSYPIMSIAEGKIVYEE
ncbi:MAG: amidohydrolase family protein [Thermoproteota archaeon]|nr:amidohydrolase family protein [Thermoproteota archaeon]